MYLIYVYIQIKFIYTSFSLIYVSTKNIFPNIKISYARLQSKLKPNTTQYLLKKSANLQILALGMPQFLKILVQTKFGKFILQMYPEIHILYRVNNDIYELHTGNHEFYVKTIILGEVCHKRSESSSLRANFLEVVERGENNFVATLYQTDSSKKFQNQSFRSEKKIMFFLQPILQQKFD